MANTGFPDFKTVYNNIGLEPDWTYRMKLCIGNLGKWNSVKWNETRRIGAIFACFYVARVWQRQLGFLVNLFHHQPIAVKTLLHDRNLGVLYNASPKIWDLPKKFLRPKTCKIWDNFIQLHNFRPWSQISSQDIQNRKDMWFSYCWFYCWQVLSCSLAADSLCENLLCFHFLFGAQCFVTNYVCVSGKISKDDVMKSGKEFSKWLIAEASLCHFCRLNWVKHR